MNKHDHRRAYPDDHGIRFEPVVQPILAVMEPPAETRKSKGRRVAR